MALAGGRLKRDPYQTTYKREFVGHVGQPAVADRPMTSKGVMPPPYKLSGATTSSTDFAEKPIKASQSILRSGTSSGNRRNNPHPHEGFMVWKFPKNKDSEHPDSKWTTELTNDLMDKICRGKCRSTYQQDYRGIPLGQKMDATNQPEGWKSLAPSYSVDSMMRQAYQTPQQQAILQGNTTRYGCNRHKNVAAIGTVPNTTNTQMHIQARTTYEREFSDAVPANTSDLRDIGRRLGAETLQKYIDATDENQKETLTAMLKSPTGSRGGSRSSSRKARVPEATQVYTCKQEDFKPRWLSSWTGPM